MEIIRSAHFPQDPAWMDACDELGLFMIVTTPGWQFWNESLTFEQGVYDNIRQWYVVTVIMLVSSFGNQF